MAIVLKKYIGICTFNRAFTHSFFMSVALLLHEGGYD